MRISELDEVEREILLGRVFEPQPVISLVNKSTREIVRDKVRSMSISNPNIEDPFDSRPCMHCGGPEGSHSGEPHQYKIFIPSRRCPGSGEFPSHVGAGLSYFEEAEKYWTERDTQYTPVSTEEAS